MTTQELDAQLQSMAVSMAISTIESRLHRQSVRVVALVTTVVTIRLAGWGDLALVVTATLALREIIPSLFGLRALWILKRHYRQLLSRV